MEQVDDLLLQVRTAHRLLAAYYQRMVPTIKEMANKLELDFSYWGNADFGLTPRTNHNITEYWQWDLLPGINTNYLYSHFQAANKVRIGDYLVEFIVVSDTGVDSHGNGHKNEPDALNLPLSVDKAQSLLRVVICAPYQTFEDSWYNNIWAGTAYPDFSRNPSPAKDKNGETCILTGYECPLAELMSDDGAEQLVELIKRQIDRTVAAAQAEHERAANGLGVAL
ncbi:hypothetical protein ACNPKB_04260 [Shewanella marisflavi]|uniref:hypothetical protein n=1 Tax=Shewanella marisflavi TaxID=260364 RepID=UPI003AAAD406